MKVGVTIAANVLNPFRPRSFAEMVADAVEAEELGYDSVWVMDHVFIDRGEVRVPAGPDPMTLLSYIAARTERVQLGTLVLCAPFRPPAQLAREAKALQEASAGRFILGVGSGWHQPEFDAFGFPFDHRVGRFEDYLEVLTRLLGDGRSSFEGRYQALRHGQVFGSGSPPPWIAASGPRMLALTGRLASGWNGAWYGPDTALFRQRLAAVEASLKEAGRSRDDFTASAGIFVVPGAGASPRLVTGDLDEVGAAVSRFADAGCDHAILNFAPTPFTQVDPELATRMAPLIDRFH